MNKDIIKIETELIIRVREKKGGEIIDETVTRNTLTDTGIAVAAGLYGNVDAQNAFIYLALSTNDDTPSTSDTALIDEITSNGFARSAALVSRVTTTLANDTTQLYKEWAATGSQVIKKAGFFNASSGGIMGGSALTGAKDIHVGQTLAVTYKIKHTAG